MRSGYRGQLKSGSTTTREQTNKKISEALKITEEEKANYIEKLQGRRVGLFHRGDVFTFRNICINLP